MTTQFLMFYLYLMWACMSAVIVVSFQWQVVLSKFCIEELQHIRWVDVQMRIKTNYPAHHFIFKWTRECTGTGLYYLYMPIRRCCYFSNPFFYFKISNSLLSQFLRFDQNVIMADHYHYCFRFTRTYSTHCHCTCPLLVIMFNALSTPYHDVNVKLSRTLQWAQFLLLAKSNVRTALAHETLL